MRATLRWFVLACALAFVPGFVPGAFAQESDIAPALAADGESLTHFAKSIVLDQKQIWTSPFHMTRKTAPIWLGFGAIATVLIATDRRSSRQLPNTLDQLAFAGSVSQVGAIYTLIPITGGMYLGGLLTHNTKVRETGLMAAQALLDGVIVTEALKLAMGRQRPLEGDGSGHFFQGGDAFPSGHTAGSFALASVVAHQYHGNKTVAIVAYGLATVVGASRFSARQHYGSDIVVGGAIGWFIGRHVYETHQAGERPRAKAWLSPEITPTVQPSDRSYGIMLAWHPHSN